MPSFDRSPATDPEVIDRWSGGFGWLAHPDEAGLRASHAIRCDDGVWIVDPVDAPRLDERIDVLGEVAGVVTLSSYHARDAGSVATRHDVPVYVPEWMDRIEERLDAQIRRFDGEFGNSGFRIRRYEALSLWQEAFAYRESDGTLIVPDSLGAAEKFTVGGERVGVVLPLRLAPPRETLADVTPQRILFGHGEGVFEDAAEALADALDGARRRFPRALATKTGTTARLFAAAALDG